MGVRGAWLLSLGLVACGPPPSPAPEPPTLAIEPSSGSFVASTSTQIAPAKACKLTTGDYVASAQRWDLTRRSAGLVWGTLVPKEGGRGQVVLEGKRGEVVAHSFEGDGLRLAGPVQTDSVEVYATEPVWFEDVILAEPSHDLDWRTAAGDEVRVAIELEEELTPSQVERDLPCDVLSLHAPDLEVSDVVDVSHLQTWSVQGHDPLPIFAASEGGRPAFTMRVDDGDLLQAGEAVADRRRLILQRSRYTLAGWVPAARLHLPPGGIGYGSGGGTGLGVAPKPKPRRRRDHACSRRIDLHVELRGEREVVGSLDPGRVFWVDDLEPVEDGWRRLHLDRDPVRFQAGARWVIAEATLAGCHPP